MKWILLTVSYIVAIIIIKYANKYIYKMSGVYFADIIIPLVYIPIINGVVAFISIIIAMCEFLENIEINIKDDGWLVKIIDKLCKVVH